MRGQVCGVLHTFRMTAKTNSGNGDKQIPFGDDNQRNNDNEEATTTKKIQGSLHSAADGDAVRRFGRDDGLFSHCLADP